jgi:hypothetical protein
VISPYNAQNQSVAWWQNLVASLAAKGIDVAFFPLFQGFWNYYNYESISYGFSDWGVRSPSINAQYWLTAGQGLQSRGKKWMTPVAPQDFRPKAANYWEAVNSENFRVMWRNAIDGGADWVQLITWNDYSEATEIAPSTGTQWSFYDLSAYYLTWFKTGSQPAVTKDTILYFHRKHRTTTMPNPALQTAGPFQQVPGSDPASDQLEVLVFATAPATLRVTYGDGSNNYPVPAGLSTFKLPLAAGGVSAR